MQPKELCWKKDSELRIMSSLKRMCFLKQKITDLSAKSHREARYFLQAVAFLFILRKSPDILIIPNGYSSSADSRSIVYGKNQTEIDFLASCDFEYKNPFKHSKRRLTIEPSGQRKPNLYYF